MEAISLIIALAMLILLAVTAMRYGVDSRIDERSRRFGNAE